MLVFAVDPHPGNTPGIVFGLAEGGIETVVASLAVARAWTSLLPLPKRPAAAGAPIPRPDGHLMPFFQNAPVQRRRSC